MSKSVKKRVFSRLAVSLVLLLLAGLSLPWWIPESTVGKILCGQLAGQLGKPVSIGRAQLRGWNGLRLEDVRIGRDNLPGSEPLAWIQQIDLHYHPLRLVREQSIQQLHIEGMILSLATGEDGKINLMDSSPSEVKIETIELRNSRIQIKANPYCPKPPDIWYIDTLRIQQSDPAEILCRLTVRPATRPGASISIQAIKTEPSKDHLLIRGHFEMENIPSQDIVRTASCFADSDTNACSWEALTAKMDGRISAQGHLFFQNDNTTSWPVPNNQGQEKDWMPILCFLRDHVQLYGQIRIDHLCLTDEDTEAVIRIHPFQADYRIGQEKAEFCYSGTVNGGELEGQMECDWQQPEMPIRHYTAASGLKADGAISPMVESEFPGLQVQGLIHDRYELYTSAAELLEGNAHWSGMGQTVCTDGRLYGPGGADWILALLPKLKLVEYRWERMTNEYEKTPDGRKFNNIVFLGKDYDIYLDGVTWPLEEKQPYDQAVELLKQDCIQAGEQLEDLDRKASEDKNRRLYLSRRYEGLGQLLKQIERGERLRISRADYIVGGAVVLDDGPLLEPPRLLTKIPAFRSKGYIIGKYMVGLKTTMAAGG